MGDLVHAVVAVSDAPVRVPERPEDAMRMVLQLYEEEYKDATDVWKSLEAKAQAVVAIAGIFIGGLAQLGLVKSGLPVPKACLALGALLFLTAGLCFALSVLSVSTVAQRPRGEWLYELFGVERQSTKPLLVVQIDLSDQWSNALSELRDALHAKAARLRIAHWLLTSGSVFAALALLAQFFSSSTPEAKP